MGQCIGKIGHLQVKQGSVEWVIPDFFSLRKEFMEYFRSDSFQFLGKPWHLTVSPETTLVRLVKEAPSAECYATFKLGLKKADGTFEGEEEHSRIFENGSDQYSCRSLCRSVIEKRRSELVPKGVLTIMCVFKSEESSVALSADPISVKEPSKEEVPELTKLALSDPIAEEGPSNFVELSTQKCSDPIAEEGPSNFVELSTQKCCTDRLSRDLIELLLSGANSDLTIKVKGEEFRLHRLIMGARTPVFSAMLSHDMAEKATGIVSVEDCEPDVFRDFVRYVYSGKVDELSTETVFGLFALADKYQVEELKSACFEFIQRTLSADTFCDVVTVAITYDKRELLERATDYFAERMEDILQTVKWMNFMREHYIQANELLLKAVKKNKPK